MSASFHSLTPSSFSDEARVGLRPFCWFDDDHVLACALAADADLIVSGDKRHLLPLGNYLDIPIVTAAEAVIRIEAEKKQIEPLIGDLFSLGLLSLVLGAERRRGLHRLVE